MKLGNKGPSRRIGGDIMTEKIQENLVLFVDRISKLGIKLDRASYSSGRKDAIEGFQFQFIRSKTTGIMEKEPYNEFYVYLLKVMYTFVPYDDDFEDSIRNLRFKKILKKEEENRVIHVHYTDKNRDEVLPTSWIETLEDGYWQYDITQEEFETLLNEDKTPLEKYLSYGI